MRIGELAFAAVVLGAGTTTAVAQPMKVQPLLVAPSGDPRTTQLLKTAVGRLVQHGYLRADVRRIRTVGLGSDCIRNLECVGAARQLKRHGGQVAVIAYDQMRRSADHEVRCVGPDPLRHYRVRVNLSDASSMRRAIADPQLTKLARCIIRSIQPPRRAE